MVEKKPLLLRQVNQKLYLRRLLGKLSGYAAVHAWFECNTCLCFCEGFLKNCLRNVINDARDMGMYTNVDGITEKSFEGLNTMDVEPLEDLISSETI